MPHFLDTLFQRPQDARRRTPRPVTEDQEPLKAFLADLLSPDPTVVPATAGIPVGEEEPARQPRGTDFELFAPLPPSPDQLSPLPVQDTGEPVADTVNAALEPVSVEDLFTESLMASNPRTGVVDTITGSKFGGGAGGELTFSDDSTIQVSPELVPGLTITNPFADDTLSDEQARRLAKEEETIQRVAQTARRKQMEEAFRTKWRRARRVLPTLPEAQKQQVQLQMQRELAELHSPDPLDLFDIYSAEDSPEVKLSAVRETVRGLASNLYGDDQLANQIAELYSLDKDGGINSEFATPIIRIAEERRQQETQFRQEQAKQEFAETRDRDRSIDAIRKFAEGVFSNRDLASNPQAHQALMARIAAHQQRFGALPGPAPEKISKNSLPAVYDWLYNMNASGSNAQAGPAAKPVKPRAVQGGRGQKLVVVDTVKVESDADIMRAKQEVDRLRASGQPNATIRVILGDGTTRTIQ